MITIGLRSLMHQQVTRLEHHRRGFCLRALERHETATPAEFFDNPRQERTRRFLDMVI